MLKDMWRKVDVVGYNDLEEAVDEQTAAAEGSGNIIVDTVSALKKIITKNTEAADANLDAMQGTQEVRVTNLSAVVNALNEVEERLGLPLTVNIDESV